MKLCSLALQANNQMIKPWKKRMNKKRKRLLREEVQEKGLASKLSRMPCQTLTSEMRLLFHIKEERQRRE